jgi:UDP-sulfoquinovose synthase
MPSPRGHEVHAIDNYLRRRIHRREQTDSLTPIASLADRIEAWREVSGTEIKPFVGSIEDFTFLDAVIAETLPEAVVHYGEQPSAPYSMKDRASAFLTQQNNVLGTRDVLWAIREHVPDAHLVKLGTMGEYGTPNIDIEEGWIDIQPTGADRMPQPRRGVSVTTAKGATQSTSSCRNLGMTTDLNQGVVCGIETPETVPTNA